jgi:hypothetical protein
VSPQTTMSRVAVLPLITLLVALASAPAAAADAPPSSAPREAAQLSESEAIQIAADEAKRLDIDLAHFEPPSATYVSDGHGGKWHIFYVAKAEHHDTCFSVDIYRSGVRPRLFRCSL